MLIKKILYKLKKSKEFEEWKLKNPAAFLTHVFILVEPGRKRLFDVGFFDRSANLMTAFLVDESISEISIKQDKNVFMHPNNELLGLDEKKINVDFEAALESALAVQKTGYPIHVPIKEVVILQHLDVGQVWNITFVTQSFKTLNIKIDSDSGRVIEDKLMEIFEFK